ncbi:dioxygenase [Pendulispora albinea]|uniref:Dioxygenase n=1 Tax=Pendulispora albinea TaxID=2741071 RepID=A0ABZ2LQL5_9BACT
MQDPGNGNTDAVASSGSSARRMPVGFVGHGSPMIALDVARGAELTAWSKALPRRPRAVLVISAHWEDAPLTLSSISPGTSLVYDFSGFPDALYAARHDAPAAPELAQRVMELAAPWRPRTSARGLDHGAWTVLTHFDPQASWPTLQVSMPYTARAEELVALGRALEPLRDEDVWILGSGNITHNLRRLDRSGTGELATWAADFDAWVEHALSSGAVDALCAPERAPGWAIAHPTPEHYRPLLVALGAAGGDVATVRFPVVGFDLGSLSRRSVEFG